MTYKALLPICSVLLTACVSHVGRPDRANRPTPHQASFTVQRDVTYSPEGWPQALKADLYLPADESLHPAIVMVHGGGWDSRDRSDMTSISRKLAKRGYVVLNVEYRHAPEFLYPAALEDVRVATRWLRTNADRLHVDPSRIGGWGYSAGAHLVALAAVTTTDPDARLQAVVAGGTPADLPHYPVSPIISKFIGADFASARQTWLDASPVEHVTSGDPPMFLYHGTWDRLVYVEDAIKMKQALDAAGVPSQLYLVRGGAHITTFLLGFGAERAGVEFLDQYLRGP